MKQYDGKKKKQIRVLFAHNSVPEYRLEFWKELGKKAELDLFITRQYLDKKIYGFDKNTENLTITYLTISALDKMRKKIRNYDCVILPPADTVLEYIIGVYLSFLCGKNRIPYIYWTEKWEASVQYQPRKKKIKNFCQRKMINSLCNQAGLCIAAGTKSKEYFQILGIDEKKIKVVIDSSTSPVPDHRFDIRETYNLPADTKIILYLGRVVRRKGYAYLLDASLPILKEQNAYLFICGDGEALDDCRHIVESSNNCNVVITGKIQPSERKNYYLGADVLVLPSYSLGGVCEAWGLTVNEALECGTPVIVSGAVGAGYDLITEKNGFMVREQDVCELRDAICAVLTNTENYNRESIKEEYKRYSVLHMAEGFYQAIVEVGL